MKKVLKNIIVLVVLSVCVISCKKDDDVSAPVIKSLEVGAGHDHGAGAAVHAGKDMHIEAKIEAEGKIDYVEVTIHHEGDHDHAHKAEHEGEVEWEFTKKFTGLKGQKNGTFHKHIDVPANAEEGDYHFHFKVVDLLGNSTEKEVELKIHEADE